MKKFILFLGLIAFVLTGKSQEINGSIFSQADKKPVEFASVVLLNSSDSSLISGSITYTGGGYSFSNVKPGDYVVKSTFVGFENGFMPVSVVGEGTTIADTMFLTEKATAIDEVTVTGDLPRGEELVDRTVYSIPPELAKSSTNGYEILQKIPSVQVDFNNNVTLNGTSNFIITVDGKERDKEFLARLLPEHIKSVEIIHNPSGKYDASIDGVINIKLTEEARVGVSGNVAIAAKPGKKTNMYFGNAGIDYGFKKVTFYLSGYGFMQNLQNNTSNEFEYGRMPLVDSTVDMSGAGDFSIAAGSVNTGFDYYINKKNTLSFNYSLKPNSMVIDLQNEGLISGNFGGYNKLDDNKTGTRSNESNFSLYYKKEFKKPIQELTLETNYYMFGSNEENDYTSQIDYASGELLFGPRNRDEEVINDRSYFRTKIDFVYPLGVSARLETGYQIYYQGMQYDFSSSEAMNNNIFDYSEFRNAVYGGITYSYKKWSLKGTLRSEYSFISINDTASNDYPVILPSANIQYKINGKQNIKFTYNSRINRPGIYRLNPYIKTDNNNNLSSGNANLEPELLNKLELKYTLNFKKNFISPYIYHRFMSNKISNINQQATSLISSDTVNYSSPANVLTGYETGFGLNAMLWMFNIDGRIFKGHYNEHQANGYTIAPEDYFSYNVRSYVFAPLLKKKLNMFAFVGYQGVRVDAQSKTYSTPFYGFGGRYNLDPHSFGIFYFLPLQNELTINRTVTETSFMNSEFSNSFDVKYFIQMQYSYKFGKGSVKKLSRKADVESDTRQEGIGR